MKSIFYILSVLIIAAAAYFSWDNSKKIQTEIDNFADNRTVGTKGRPLGDNVRGKKIKVEENIKETEAQLADTEGSLEEAKTLNAELTQTKENEVSKQGQMERSIEKFNTEIEESDVQLAKFAEIKKKIDEQIGGLPVPWDEIEKHIGDLEEKRKRLGDDHDNLVQLVAKLTKEVADKRAENGRQDNRLKDIRRRIALNDKVGAITSVNSTWGFVIVNLGTNNSNVTLQSKLLVTRNGRVVARLSPNSVEAAQTICDLNAKDVTPGVRIQPGDSVTLADTVAN